MKAHAQVRGRWSWSVRRRQTMSAIFAASVVVFVLMLSAGCSTSEEKRDPVSPPPAFTGPRFLHGTVGSMTRVRGFAPVKVSGYGIVVGLPGTGSDDCPAHLKQWMLNKARQMGVGSVRLRSNFLGTPAEFLASNQTAIVKITGFIPAGATTGTRFDIFVESMPNTQTTSLKGGTLWTAELGIAGAEVGNAFTKPLAIARGPIYINPLEDRKSDFADQNLIGVVLSGGVTKEDSKIELVLNQPSWQRSRMIADRMNERFGKGREDKYETAVAKTDLIIGLNIPEAFARDPKLLLDLVAHLYVQRGPNFELTQAKGLPDIAIADRQYALSASLAWESLGKRTLPVVRGFYAHPDITVRIAALRAGSRLGDPKSIYPLVNLSKHQDPKLRRDAARMLVHLPPNMPNANRALVRK